MIKLTIDNLLLSSNTNLIPSQGSANIPVELINLSTDYSDYALIPCIGWLKNGIIISTTREVIDFGGTKTFTIPPEAFLQNGLIYISVGLVKDNENAKTQTLAFKVSMAPTSDVQLPSDGSWETAVSSLVTSLFNDRFENEIDNILKNAETLNKSTEELQQKINVAIDYMGDYEWSGTKIRFRLGDGSWGDYKDIAGDFAKESEVMKLKNAFTSVTSLTKQLFLLMHPVGSIYMSTSSTSPQTTFGGTWVRWGNGRVPVGVDIEDTDFNTVEKTGGYKVSDLRALIGATGSNASRLGYYAKNPVSAHGTYSINLSANVVDSQPVNHSTLVLESDGHVPSRLQPYITCYIWKRTA